MTLVAFLTYHAPLPTGHVFLNTLCLYFDYCYYFYYSYIQIRLIRIGILKLRLAAKVTARHDVTCIQTARNT